MDLHKLLVVQGEQTSYGTFLDTFLVRIFSFPNLLVIFHLLIIYKVSATALNGIYVCYI